MYNHVRTPKILQAKELWLVYNILKLPIVYSENIWCALYLANAPILAFGKFFIWWIAENYDAITC